MSGPAPVLVQPPTPAASLLGPPAARNAIARPAPSALRSCGEEEKTCGHLRILLLGRVARRFVCYALPSEMRKPPGCQCV